MKSGKHFGVQNEIKLIDIKHVLISLLMTHQWFVKHSRHILWSLWRKIHQNMMHLNFIMSIHIPRKMTSNVKWGPGLSDLIQMKVQIFKIQCAWHFYCNWLKVASLKTEILPVIASNLLFYPLSDDIELLITTIISLNHTGNLSFNNQSIGIHLSSVTKYSENTIHMLPIQQHT